ncbi:MAG: hypothetical protein ACLR1T_10275 [Evtepia gabavorous]
MSVFGALGHNAGQLAVAVWVSGTPALAFYAHRFFCWRGLSPVSSPANAPRRC